MENQDIRSRVHDVLRRSEVSAVAQLIRDGRRPALGQSVDYHIDALGALPRPGRRTLPYRLNVEPWHLAEADRLIGES